MYSPSLIVTRKLGKITITFFVFTPSPTMHEAVRARDAATPVSTGHKLKSRSPCSVTKSKLQIVSESVQRALSGSMLFVATGGMGKTRLLLHEFPTHCKQHRTSAAIHCYDVYFVGSSDLLASDSGLSRMNETRLRNMFSSNEDPFED